MEDLDHRRQGHLDMPRGVAWGIHEAEEDNWGHVPWEDREAGRVHRIWPAGLAVDISAAHFVEAAWRPSCGDADKRYGPVRKLALERIPA